MLAAPGQPVHLRTYGLHDWDSAARRLGAAVGDVLTGGVDLLGLAQVRRTGEMAAFSERLRGISAEAREELQDAEVKDWDYSWNAAVAPRLAEAVQELSEESREGGLELARAYSAQASIEAKRDRELKRLETARQRWQQRVDESVSAGQEEQAARWLEAGRGVFVPEAQMEGRRAELRSRACLSRWESRLSAEPLPALAALAEARGKAGRLPSRREEREGLEARAASLRLALRRELAQDFSARVQAGEELPAATLELAARAGLLPEVERAQASSSPQPLTTAERSQWRRWVDERAEGEEGELDARLALAAAPLPPEERRALLTRLELTASLPVAERRSLSRELFSLYASGLFGCPGDAEAEDSLLSLQEEGLSLLAGQGAAAVADWLEAQRRGAEHWLCYEESSQPQSV